MSNNNMNNQALAVQNQAAPVSLDSQREFLQTLINSGKIAVKTVEEAYTIVRFGKELGFEPMAAIQYIINVRGRLTLSVKAMKALLLKGGVTWRTIYDGAYVYADGSIEEFNVTKDGNKPIDKISKIEFTRKMGDVTMVEVGTFTFREAQQADLVKPASAWTTYPRQMLSSRAFSNGADKIASDLLLGMYSADDMINVEKVDESRVIRNSEGEVEQILEAEVVK